MMFNKGTQWANLACCPGFREMEGEGEGRLGGDREEKEEEVGREGGRRKKHITQSRTE